MARYYRRRGRRTYRRRSYVPRRYSPECQTIAGFWDADNFLTTQYFAVVPPAGMQGVRKVANISVDFALETGANLTFGWALVYWPNAERLFAGDPGNYVPALADPQFNVALSLYEPNQHVLMQGIFNTTDMKSFRRFTRLSRNLQSEDSLIFLIRGYAAEVAPTDEQHVNFAMTFSYAITF